MRKRAWMLSMLALAIGAPALAQSRPDAKRIERGTAVYREQKCQACHSIAGAGNKRYPLDGVGSRLTEEEIRKWIVAPREMNPRVAKRAYKLPQEDLDALVEYMKSLRKP
jgi:mono/diheme cytochrome c family protein